MKTATLTCMSLGQTETITQSGMGQVDIQQDGCNIQYTVPDIDIPRIGTIDGNNISYNGPLAVPFLDDIEFEENNVSINGTVNGNRIDLTGTGKASGTLSGIPFSCTGDSTSLFTRANAQADNPQNTTASLLKLILSDVGQRKFSTPKHFRLNIRSYTVVVRV
ncbi:MAG: hypothetical protein R3F37_11770 [Candidatus Competibacteraceae bacterium]